MNKSSGKVRYRDYYDRTSSNDREHKGFLYETTFKAIANQKRVACHICGCEFTPLNDNGHYIVKSSEGNLADAFDCPQCGCQLVVNERCEKADRYAKIRENYRKICDEYENRIRKMIRPVTEHTFSNVKSFTKALELIHECMDDYKYISLAAFKRIIGESGTCAEAIIGWNNILDMRIEVDGNGYTLIMPPFNWVAGKESQE